MNEDEVEIVVTGRSLKSLSRVFGRLGGRSLMVNLAAALGALMVLADTGRQVGEVLVVASLLLVLYFSNSWRLWSPALYRERFGAGKDAKVGGYAVARVLAAITVALLADAKHDGAALIVGLVLGVPVILETFAQQVVRIAYPYASNTPWHETRNWSRFGAGGLFLLNTLTILGSWVLVIAGVQPAPIFVLSLCGIVYLALVLVDAIGRVRARWAFDARLAKELKAYEPKFVLYWEAARGTAYQIGTWLPYLDRLGQNYVVVLRSRRNLTAVEQLTDAPILVRPSIPDLDAIIVPSINAAFYVNNSVRNCHLVRYRSMTHIQLNHGDSDKAPSYNPVFRMYDKNFVAGQAAIDRFVANDVPTHPGFFSIVGRPQVEDIEVCDHTASPVTPKTVLYAPTWAGFVDDSAYSSLGIAVPMIKALLERGCRVIFRPHPYSRKSPELAAARNRIIGLLDDAKTKTGVDHLYGQVAEVEMSVVDCFNAADAMISDISSVVPDFLYSQKPFAMVSMQGPAEQLAQEFRLASAAYVLEADLSNMASVLDDLLESDPLEQLRIETKTYYLGDFPADSYADAFLDEAGRYIQ